MIFLYYVGKHEKKWYLVWRVLGPAGPVEETYVFGRQEAEALCMGCWDWEITPVDLEEFGFFNRMTVGSALTRNVQKMHVSE